MSVPKRKSSTIKPSESSSTCILKNAQSEGYRKKPALFQRKLQNQIKEHKMNVLLQIRRNPQPPVVPRLINGIDIRQLSTSKSLFMQAFESGIYSIILFDRL